MTNHRLSEIQRSLRELGLEAWLLYSFRDSNPISVRMLGLTPEIHQSRRWACLIPAEGAPRGLVHRIEPHIGRLIDGSVIEYSSHEEFQQGLRSILSGVRSVAMEYSPGNAIPVISRVDAGTVELVRSIGVDVQSSGGLIARLEARLSDEQIASARRAGGAVREIMLGAFDLIAGEIGRYGEITEYQVQQHILNEFRNRSMVTDHPPICGVGPNSANPHYEPTEERSEKIREGDFVLIDLWARENQEGSVFGDITWVGFAGKEVPESYHRIFEIVRDARDAAFQTVVDAFEQERPIRGADLDRVARNIIVDAGYGQYFVHRTGHSITTELHGAGANLDSFETEDTRPILAGTSFSIEPGIYLPGDFGVRSELDVVITHDGEVLATSEPLQREVVAILR